VIGFLRPGSGEEAGQPGEGGAALRDADDAAGEHADHVIEKTAAVKGECDEGGVVFDLEGPEGADGIAALVFAIAAVGGKGGEIMLALAMEAGGFEEGEIEGMGNVPGEAGLQRGKNGAGPEAVAVGFSYGIEAGVEIVRSESDVHDPDGRREVDIEGALPGGEIHAAGVRDVAVGHLAEGMDAGIGAAAAVDGDGGRGFEYFRDGCFEEILHGIAAGLALPSGEGTPVPGDGEAEAHGAG